MRQLVVGGVVGSVTLGVVWLTQTSGGRNVCRRVAERVAVHNLANAAQLEEAERRAAAAARRGGPEAGVAASDVLSRELRRVRSTLLAQEREDEHNRRLVILNVSPWSPASAPPPTEASDSEAVEQEAGEEADADVAWRRRLTVFCDACWEAPADCTAPALLTRHVAHVASTSSWDRGWLFGVLSSFLKLHTDEAFWSEVMRTHKYRVQTDLGEGQEEHSLPIFVLPVMHTPRRVASVEPPGPPTAGADSTKELGAEAKEDEAAVLAPLRRALCLAKSIREDQLGRVVLVSDNDIVVEDTKAALGLAAAPRLAEGEQETGGDGATVSIEQPLEFTHVRLGPPCRPTTSLLPPQDDTVDEAAEGDETGTSTTSTTTTTSDSSTVEDRSVAALLRDQLAWSSGSATGVSAGVSAGSLPSVQQVLLSQTLSLMLDPNAQLSSSLSTTAANEDDSTDGELSVSDAVWSAGAYQSELLDLIRFSAQSGLRFLFARPQNEITVQSGPLHSIHCLRGCCFTTTAEILAGIKALLADDADFAQQMHLRSQFLDLFKINYKMDTQRHAMQQKLRTALALREDLTKAVEELLAMPSRTARERADRKEKEDQVAEMQVELYAQDQSVAGSVDSLRNRRALLTTQVVDLYRELSSFCRQQEIEERLCKAWDPANFEAFQFELNERDGRTTEPRLVPVEERVRKLFDNRIIGVPVAEAASKR